MDALVQQWSIMSFWTRAQALTALPATGYALARFQDEYRDWLRLGPGGLPPDIRGFIVTLLLTGVLAKSETKSLAMYDRPEKHVTDWNKATEDEKRNAKKSFMKAPLPQREGKVSNAKGFVAPQRERNIDDLKYLDPKITKRTYRHSYNLLATTHNDAIECKTSVLEKQGQAMFLKPTYALPTLLAKCWREILHIHESDLSAHVLLSLADAQEVLAKGWGERHRISGTFALPLTYTMLYLPRTLAEVEVLVGILEAGVEYAKSNGKML